MSQTDYLTIPHFQIALKRFLKVIDCTQQLHLREERGGIWEGAKSS